MCFWWWLSESHILGVAAGIALRVPTPNVSIVDLVVQVEKKTFAEEVNAAFQEASAGAMKVLPQQHRLCLP